MANTVLAQQDTDGARGRAQVARGRALFPAVVGQAALLLCAVACAGGGKGESDQPGEGADQYELVIVDGAADSAGAEVPEARAASAPVDTGGVVRFRPEGTYTVQVGMYADAGQAATVVQELAASGYPAYGMARPDGHGVRVRVGYFDSREEADLFGQRFRKDTGADYWVDLRANEED